MFLADLVKLIFQMKIGVITAISFKLMVALILLLQRLFLHQVEPLQVEVVILMEKRVH